MQLINEFKAACERVGKIEQVWLTSFTIDIEFIEKYLLPIIVGDNSVPPRTYMDFERLQQMYVESEVDVRVFCDKRFLEGEAGEKWKRTSVPVHGVLPHGNGLFHPKVIFIQGEKGAVIGSGSANLTISGWGRNREVFKFLDIQSQALLCSVRSFFNGVFADAALKQEAEIKGLKRFKKQEQASVEFHHSYARQSFIERLITKRTEKLTVWSPYFSSSITGFIKKLEGTCKNNSIQYHIVPDLTANGKIRASQSDWNSSLDDSDAELLKRIKFYSRPKGYEAESNGIVHAKIWATETELAIGSWNFTQPGSNLNDEEGSDYNIESGLIFSSQENSELCGEEIKNPEFSSAEELKESELEVPKLPPFSLRVELDWKTQTYTVVVHFAGGNDAQREGILAKYKLALPGVDKAPSLTTKSVAIDHEPALLGGRCYKLLKNGETVGCGFIIEKNKEFRRSQTFPDLASLIDSAVLEIDHTKSSTFTFREPQKDDSEFPAESDSENITSTGDKVHASYFKMFLATQNFRKKLEDCANTDELHRVLRTEPGCLIEWVEKTKELIENSNEASTHRMYVWFLVQEVKQLVSTAKSRLKQLGGGNNFNWKQFNVSCSEPEINAETMNWVKQELKTTNAKSKSGNA